MKSFLTLHKIVFILLPASLSPLVSQPPTFITLHWSWSPYPQLSKGYTTINGPLSFQKW